MSSLALWKRYTYDLIAAEVSSITHYFDRVIQVAPLAGDTQELLARIECRQKDTASEDSLPDLTSERDRRTAAFLNGNLNHDLHIQGTLRRIGSRLSRNGRVIVVAYNAYYQGLYKIAVRLGLKEGATPSTFVTYADVGNLARLSGLELVRARPAVYCPWRFFGIGHLINAVMPLIPLLRSTALVSILVFRPTKVFTSDNPSISVIVPARNERESTRWRCLIRFGRSSGKWRMVNRYSAMNHTCFSVVIQFRSSKRARFTGFENVRSERSLARLK